MLVAYLIILILVKAGKNGISGLVRRYLARAGQLHSLFNLYAAGTVAQCILNTLIHPRQVRSINWKHVMLGIETISFQLFA
jgi:hypothetical protein